MTSVSVNRCRVLTPAGAGAIGVIRLEGLDVKEVIASMLRRPNESPRVTECSPGSHPTRRWTDLLPHSDRLVYGLLVAGGETLDDVVVSQGPGTDTVIDICTHGGVRVMERIIEALECRGVLLADDPGVGEPLWRTDNLIEREADDALVRAKTVRAVRFIMRQRAVLPAELRRIADQCLEAPDDARRALEGLMDGFRGATRLIDGATIVFLGPPNGGKSTLFNHLVGRTAAVVSPTAGTTRDWVSAEIDLDGVPVTLVDTAGRHAAPCNLERLAIDTGRHAQGRADALVVVLDCSMELPGNIRTLAEVNRAEPPLLFVSNRRDVEVWGIDELSAAVRRPVDHFCRVAATTGEGLEDLNRQLLRLLGFAGSDVVASLFSRRQLEAAEPILSDLPLDGAWASNSVIARILQTDLVSGPMSPR